MPFEDVVSNTYYDNYVSWAFMEGITNGISDTLFSPNSSITRDQAAVMIHNYLMAYDLMPDLQNKECSFIEENDISLWAKNSVKIMQELGIISGRGNGKFDPNSNIIHAEVVAI